MSNGGGACCASGLCCPPEAQLKAIADFLCNHGCYDKDLAERLAAALMSDFALMPKQIEIFVDEVIRQSKKTHHV